MLFWESKLIHKMRGKSKYQQKDTFLSAFSHFGKALACWNVILKLIMKNNYAKISYIDSPRLITVTYTYALMLSLCPRTLLHWNRQFRAQLPVPRDGHGLTRTIPGRLVPIMQAPIWPKDSADDCGLTHTPYWESPRGANHSSWYQARQLLDWRNRHHQR